MSDCGATFSMSVSNVSSACVSAEQFEQGFGFSFSVVPPKSFLIQLDEVIFDDKVFRLNAPIFVTVSVEDGVWFCENKEFSSLSFGPTVQQSVQSFCEDFSVLWDEIAKAPDETLSGDAQKVKQALLATVKTVEAA